MRRSTQPESVQVALHRSRVDSDTLHSLLQENWVVNSLSSRQNLFTSHEEVVRVGEVRVCRVGHGVEGSDGQWEFVKDEVVGLVLFSNQSA
jgi:hypothetical protein